jgi:hypothetical protein
MNETGQKLEALTLQQNNMSSGQYASRDKYRWIEKYELRTTEQNNISSGQHWPLQLDRNNTGSGLYTPQRPLELDRRILTPVSIHQRPNNFSFVQLIQCSLSKKSQTLSRLKGNFVGISSRRMKRET